MKKFTSSLEFVHWSITTEFVRIGKEPEKKPEYYFQ